CNIGFAFVRADKREWAARSWLLGLIEDALTDAASCYESWNFRNLLSAGFASSVLEQLIGAVRVRFLGENVIPILPEVAIEFWLQPTAVAPSERCLKLVDALMDRLSRAYPQIPESANSLAMLLEFWSFAEIGGTSSRG